MISLGAGADAPGPAPPDRDWFTDPAGHSYSVIRGPVEFDMGTREGEPNSFEGERLHRVRIGRSFAIATRETTLGQYREFARAVPGVAVRDDTKYYANTADCPILDVTWYEAAAYCRWLDDREKLPDSEKCYPPVETILKAGDAKLLKAGDKTLPLKLPADYLRRTGHRLPTEAEWEYACRAGSATSRPFGTTTSRLGEYAWFGENSGGVAHLIGTRRPNDFGLFDMLGNAREYCHDLGELYGQPEPGRPLPDVEDARDVTLYDERVHRGQSFRDSADAVRSAKRDWNLPSRSVTRKGFRVARTCP
jgi:formylglycine-generating enzyme required for sulfatase activity